MITDDLEIKYEIPEKYKKKFTKEFLTLFWNHLISTWNYLDKGSDWDIFYAETSIEGTGGWYDAFKETCEHLNEKELLKYYNSLAWYDSDLFDDELGSQMLLEIKGINTRTIKTPEGYYDEEN